MFAAVDRTQFLPQRQPGFRRMRQEHPLPLRISKPNPEMRSTMKQLIACAAAAMAMVANANVNDFASSAGGVQF